MGSPPAACGGGNGEPFLLAPIALHRPTGGRYPPPIPLETFYLGTDHPSWLRQTDAPLFVARRSLAGRKTLPRARGIWALDSGGFTELYTYGRWTITVAQYIAEVRRYVECIGKLQFAASMDMMCEPWIVQKTGLSVEEHQKRTLENYLELHSRAPDLPWAPVLQGWSLVQYLRYPQLGITQVMERQMICRVLRRSSLIQPLVPRVALHNVRG